MPELSEVKFVKQKLGPDDLRTSKNLARSFENRPQILESVQEYLMRFEL